MIFEIVVFWLILSTVFFGLGAAARYLCRWPMRDILNDVWLGWAIGIVVLQIWNIFLPVDWCAFACLGVIGGVGLIITRKEVISIVRGVNLIGWSLTVLLCACWLAIHTGNQIVNPDSGLYHLNSVRWAKEYAIVPGLGNLHGRLAFNQSYFLYVALLDIGPFSHKSHQLASGLLILWTLLRSFRALSLLASKNKAFAPWHLFDALMVVPVIQYVVYSENASSPTPDTGVFVLGILVASELMRFLGKEEGGKNKGNDHFSQIIPLVLIAIVGITVKLSFAAVALTTISLFLYGGVKKSGVRGSVGLGMAVMACGVLVLVPWIIRGVVLSGYPAYPSTIGAFPVDWRVPIEYAHRDSELIRMWPWKMGGGIPAEYVNTIKGYWRMIMYVGRRLQDTVIVPLALSVAGIVCGAWIRSSQKKPVSCFKSSYFIMPLAGLVYCFIMAPDPRFAGSAFWLLGMGAVVWAVVGLDRRGSVMSVIFINTLLFAHQIVVIEFMWPGTRDSGPAKTVHVIERTTNSGLHVFVAPSEEGGLPWDSPLPATDWFNPRLELRVPVDIAAGFKLQAK